MTAPAVPSRPPGPAVVLTVSDPGFGFLTANGRAHWSSRAAATKAWRLAGFWSARAAQLPKGLRGAWIDVLVHEVPLSRRRDVGNIAPTAKAVIDGLVDHGLLPDDDDEHLSGPFLHRGDPVRKGEPRRLVLHIHPRPEETQ